MASLSSGVLNTVRGVTDTGGVVVGVMVKRIPGASTVVVKEDWLVGG